MLLVGRHLNKVAMGLVEPISSITYAVYFLIPHLEFFDLRERIVHNWGGRPWGPVVLATGYGFAYMGVFLLGAWLAFRRKPLS